MKTQLRQIFKQIQPFDCIPRLITLSQAFSSFLGKRFLIFAGMIILLFLAYVLVKNFIEHYPFYAFITNSKVPCAFFCELQNHAGKLETVMMNC